jgi:hypothetical protein
VDASVIDGFAVEGDEGIGDGVVAGGNEDFFAPVGMQQHQIGTRFPPQWTEDLRPGDLFVVSSP